MKIIPKKIKNNKSKCKTYFKVNKEKLQKISREYYTNLSKDEKIKKRNYGNVRNKNMSPIEKQEYIKKE